MRQTMAFVFLEWLTSLNMITTSCIQFPARKITVFLKGWKTFIIYTMPYFFYPFLWCWTPNSAKAKSASIASDVIVSPWWTDLESADKKLRKVEMGHMVGSIQIMKKLHADGHSA